jgi:RRXRR protein
MQVFVLDKKKRPLMPCAPQRARELLKAKRAVVHRLVPFTIRLKDRLLEQSGVQPVFRCPSRRVGLLERMRLPGHRFPGTPSGRPCCFGRCA